MTERLKMEPIGILKSDQFYAVSMRLTEIFVEQNMKVISVYNTSLYMSHPKTEW